MENPNQPFPNFMFMLQGYNPRPSWHLSLEKLKQRMESNLCLWKACLITDKEENGKKEYNETHFLVETTEGKSRRRPGETEGPVIKPGPTGAQPSHLPARHRLGLPTEGDAWKAACPHRCLTFEVHHSCSRNPALWKEDKWLAIITTETVDSWSCLVLPYKVAWSPVSGEAYFSTRNSIRRVC